MNTYRLNLWSGLIVVGVFAATLSGCGHGRESELLGKWEAPSTATLAPTDLKFKADTTYTLFCGTQTVTPDKATSNTTLSGGHWKFDKDSGTLTLTRPRVDDITAHLSDDNQQLTMPNPTGAGAEVVLQKQTE